MVRKVLLLGLTQTVPVLNGHFHGDLYRNRPGIAEEDVLAKRVWSELDQLIGQLHCRLVGQPPKHNVGHAVDLLVSGPG